MKFRLLAFAIGLFALCSCRDTKRLDLDFASIQVPKTWEYKPVSGANSKSVVGTLTAPSNEVLFEYNEGGHTDGLLVSEQEFLADQKRWITKCYFCDTKSLWARADMLELTRQNIMLQKDITDSTLVHIRPIPTYKTVIKKATSDDIKKYPGADYIAQIGYRDSSATVPITVPGTIKIANIKIDTTAKYFIRMVWPKYAGLGITGLYYRSRFSTHSFSIVGHDLRSDAQAKLLEAFKTVEPKL